MSVFGPGMKILIRGFAERVASSVNDWAFGLTEAGADSEVVVDRLRDELKGGRVLGEMRRFATAFVPGYTGEIVNRFGRDTLADKKLAKSLLDEVRMTREERQAAEEAKRNLEEPDRIPWTVDEEALPEIPPDADLDQLYYWVAIHDANTCEVCEGNSELGAQTLRDWAEIGEPRSGACAGEWRCRCVLVPADDLPEGGIPGSIQLPKDR